jgi:uncharacterized protein (DUF342 family)
MRNRKRRSRQPMLEAMETRFMPSFSSVHVQHMHHERVVAVHVHEASSKNDTTSSERANNEALKNLQQQLQVVHEHALERTPSAIPTEAEKQATQVSNLFKSLESAL